MNQMIIQRNELLAQKVIKGLASRNMTGYYAASREEALKKALSLIPEYSTVTMGGAMSAHEIGLVDALKSGRKFQPGFRHLPGTETGAVHCGNE